jgi:hypothetical protein
MTDRKTPPTGTETRDDRDDRDRASEAARVVLARRAKFIAAAIAGVGIACGEPNRPPQPCLSAPPTTPDAGPGPTMPGPPMPGSLAEPKNATPAVTNAGTPKPPGSRP